MGARLVQYTLYQIVWSIDEHGNGGKDQLFPIPGGGSRGFGYFFHLPLP